MWPEACNNHRALRNVRTRSISIGGLDVILQHNPSRIVSSAADTGTEALKKRKCFLCAANRPAEQIKMEFEGRKGRKYDILLNPYPIFRDHLVIAMKEHLPQSIWRRYVDMLDLAKMLTGFTVFYNGPQCGASAPDHHHFQAAGRGRMPLVEDVDAILDSRQDHDCMEYLSSVLDADVFMYGKYLPGIFVISGKTSKSVAKMFYRLLDCADWDRETQPEPMCNVFVWYKTGTFRSVVIFRSAHRSHHYYSDGPDHLTMSPGCADMAGCLVVPVPEEFASIEKPLAESLLKEVAIGAESATRIAGRLTRRQKEVSVGIMSAARIVFEILSDGAGPRKAEYRDGKIEYDGSLYDELFFEAKTLSTMFAEPSFMLYGVTIGAGFHWERKENQKFAGSLKIIADGGGLTAVNVLGIEDYLVSVISSEMKATAPPEFLKAHAVISRSWLVRQIRGYSGHGHVQGHEKTYAPGKNETIRWYGRTDHEKFDVCADDHCQRYQGLTRATGDAVRKAVDSTWGQVLSYGGTICDARFSKCCGGATEKFSSCWEDTDPDYLQGRRDSIPDNDMCISSEEEARNWIMHEGSDTFCGKAEAGFLKEVLNSYDMETTDFMRWQTSYGREELSRIFARRSGTDVGEIQALIPLARGTSGRIFRLGVIGSSGTAVIGKELEIRRVLSLSHLKSSAFVVDYTDSSGKILQSHAVAEAAGRGEHTEFERIRLTGAGWGHGVGLCQVGAAVMAREGYGYREILRHYYPGTGISEEECTS